MRKLWESGKYKDWEGKGPGDCYGGEFVGRMLSMSSIHSQAQSLTRCSQHARDRSSDQFGSRTGREIEGRIDQVRQLVVETQ